MDAQLQSFEISDALGVEVQQIETFQHMSLSFEGEEMPVIRVTLRPPAFPSRVQYVCVSEGRIQRVLRWGF